MRSVTFPVLLAVIVCGTVTSVANADTLIYNNSIYQGYFSPGSNYDIFDYGTSSGGLVKKISFGYRNSYTTNWVRIKFYRNPNPDFYDFHLGYYLKTILIENVPPSSGTYSVFEYELPEADRFELPSGSFGYTVAVSSSNASLAMARGGAGQVDEMWEYYYGTWGWDWYAFWFGGYPSYPWTGLYMRVYEGPPIDEVTCDIAGYKFDDVNSNGVWDAGEPELPGWEFYLDTNGNNTFDPGVDPNVVTDPNGMYLFKNVDAPATYTIREVDRDGWTQTLPGGPNDEYVLNAEPNTLYTDYDFGNTTQALTYTISGYVRLDDGSPVEGFLIEAKSHDTYPATLVGSDITDASGYYEIEVAPFSGSLAASKPGYLVTVPLWVNITSDATFNFTVHPINVIYGHVLLDGVPLEGVRVSTSPYLPLPLTELGPVYTDSEGYYELEFTGTWTGCVNVSKEGYGFFVWLGDTTCHLALDSSVEVSFNAFEKIEFDDVYCKISDYLNYPVPILMNCPSFSIRDFENSYCNLVYAQFFDTPIELEIGSRYQYVIGSDSMSYGVIWVDWNQDNVFDEVTERYESSSSMGGYKPSPYGTTTVYGSGDNVMGYLTPPDDALLGQTRMRVRRSNVTACEEGAGEDYLVIVHAAGSGFEEMYAGGLGTAENPYQLSEPEHILAISNTPQHWGSYFKLINDIDMSEMDGSSYSPIGRIHYEFVGQIDGDNFKISNFAYTPTGHSSRNGIFGLVGQGAVIQNLTIENPHVHINSPENPNPRADQAIGALVGFLDEGATIINCRVQNGDIVGGYAVGALVGGSSGTIRDCSSIDTMVTAHGGAGGLVGRVDMGVVEYCTARSEVSAIRFVEDIPGSLSDNYTVSASGFAGYVDNDGTIDNCYCASIVVSEEDASGFVDYSNGTIQSCYCTGTVTGIDIAGFTDINSGAISNCYWDQGIGASSSDGAVSLPTEQMKAMSSYAGWDFESVWRMCDGMNYPRLQWEPKLVGDFVCPEGVELADLMVLSEEWLAEKMSADIAPDGGDGRVNLLDGARLAQAWLSIPGQDNWDPTCDLYGDAAGDIINELDLDVLTEQWLMPSTHHADIAPALNPDGRVNLLDFTLFAENWLLGID